MMFIKRYKHKNLILVLFFMNLFFFIFSPIIIASVVLPKTIHLIEGKEQIFELNVPVVAAFKTGKTETLKINSKDSDDSVNLNDKFSVVSYEAGESEVTLSVFGMLPVKRITVSTIPDVDIIPSGAAVGVRINTNGVMVLGSGPVKGENGEEIEPAKNILKAGDLILTANGEDIENKEQLIKIIEDSDGKEITFKLKRNVDELEVSVKPAKSEGDNSYKMGIWVRDSTQGIGTMTYYEPNSLKFGALGHGIMDVDTKKIMSIKNGNIMSSSITSSRKGKKGSPGELLGKIDSGRIIGSITSNTQFGIYGLLSEEFTDELSGEPTKIGLQNEVKPGDAYILSTIEGKNPKKYSVCIESINKYSNDDSKGMIIKITDPELLSKTSGIVQGMSGSPIIQDNKLIGAVTHVFVQDPTKGYGIFIENMLKQGDGL